MDLAQRTENRRALLEARLRTLRDETTAVLLELNSLTLPESRLPPEILADIFVYSVESSASFFDYMEVNAEYFMSGNHELEESQKTRLRHLLILTRVCHYWREIALGCGRLWSEIVVPCHPNFLALSLRRSGESNLDIVARIDNERDDSTATTALGYAHRATSLVLSALRSDLRKVNQAFVNPLHAPRLRELWLETRLETSMYMFEDPAESKAQDVVAFYSSLLLSPVLTWFRCPLSDAKSLLKSIRLRSYNTIAHLALDINAFTDTDEPIYTLHHFLPSFPSLQTLDIHVEIGCIWVSNAAIQVEKMALPSLHQLSLHDDAYRCIALLEYFSIPRTTVVDITDVYYSRYAHSDEHTTALIAAASRLASYYSGTIFRRLTVNVLTDGDCLHLWRSTKDSNAHCVEPPLLKWLLPDSDTVTVGTPRILESLPLSDVRELSLESSLINAQSRAEECWERVILNGYTSLPHISSLEVLGYTPFKTLESLIAPASGEITFPGLERILLKGLCLEQCRSQTPRCAHVKAIMQALKRRCDRGNPIARIVIEDCLYSISQSSADWEVVAGLVQEVVVVRK